MSRSVITCADYMIRRYGSKAARVAEENRIEAMLRYRVGAKVFWACVRDTINKGEAVKHG